MQAKASPISSSKPELVSNSAQKQKFITNPNNASAQKQKFITNPNNASPQNLKKDFFWNTLGDGAINFLPALLLVIVTRLNGIEDSGIFSFTFNFAIIFAMIGYFGGRNFQITDTKNEFLPRDFVFMRFCSSAIMIISSLTFALVGGYQSKQLYMFAIFIMYRAIDSVSDALAGILQVDNFLFIAGRSATIKGFVGSSVFLITDLITKNIVVASFGLLAVPCITILFYDLPKIKKIKNLTSYKNEQKHMANSDFFVDLSLKRDIKIAFTIMKKQIGLFGISITTMILLNISRFFIERYIPQEQGYFGILVMPIGLVVLFMAFMLNPFYMKNINAFENNNVEQVRKLISKICFIVLGFGVVLLISTWFFGVPVMQLVYGVSLTNYKNELCIAVLLGCIIALSYVFLSIANILRKYFIQVLTFSCTTAFLCITSIIAIPKYKMIGAMYSYLGAFIILLLLSFGIYLWCIHQKTNNQSL